jgi:hypothetical protein
MADHPDASSDQIGALAGQHIEQQTESQAFDQAFDLASDRLLERPRLTAAFDGFSEAVANNPQFERGITAALNQIDYRPLAERVIAFNGDIEPDAAGATQILIDHAFTTDRFESGTFAGRNGNSSSIPKQKIYRPRIASVPYTQR